MLNDENHKCTYNKGDLLALTIKPDDKMQGFNTPKRYQDFVSYYHTKLSRLFEDQTKFQYYFTIELSEPIGDLKGAPRLHLHGFVKLLKNISVFTFLNDVIPDIMIHALLKISHINTHEELRGWDAYIHKQIKYMPQKGHQLGSSSDAKLFSPSESKTGGVQDPLEKGSRK